MFCASNDPDFPSYQDDHSQISKGCLTTLPVPCSQIFPKKSTLEVWQLHPLQKMVKGGKTILSYKVSVTFSGNPAKPQPFPGCLGRFHRFHFGRWPGGALSSSRGSCEASGHQPCATTNHCALTGAGRAFVDRIFSWERWKHMQSSWTNLAVVFKVLSVFFSLSLSLSPQTWNRLSLELHHAGFGAAEVPMRCDSSRFAIVLGFGKVVLAWSCHAICFQGTQPIGTLDIKYINTSFHHCSFREYSEEQQAISTCNTGPVSRENMWPNRHAVHGWKCSNRRINWKAPIFDVSMKPWNAIRPSK